MEPGLSSSLAESDRPTHSGAADSSIVEPLKPANGLGPDFRVYSIAMPFMPGVDYAFWESIPMPAVFTLIHDRDRWRVKHQPNSGYPS